MYTITNVTKHYRKDHDVVRALDGIDLEIKAGESVAIQGPTGQGKSTLLQLLGGLDRPTTGSITFDGQDMAKMSELALSQLRANAFGFVFQSFNLIPTLTAIENVETALVPMSVDAAERRQRATQALADVGLAERATHFPAELSGGQQQRVAIARALVKKPRVLLADEPTGNLDEGTRDEIIDILDRLNREQELTLVVVTHDTAVAARASRLLNLKGGRLANLTTWASAATDSTN